THEMLCGVGTSAAESMSVFSQRTPTAPCIGRPSSHEVLYCRYALFDFSSMLRSVEKIGDASYMAGLPTLAAMARTVSKSHVKKLLKRLELPLPEMLSKYWRMVSGFQMLSG